MRYLAGIAFVLTALGACGGGGGGSTPPPPTHGTLDTTFGTAGVVTTSINGDDSGANAVLIQGNGKLVVLGGAWNSTNALNFAAARYNTDGSLDASFGTGGAVETVVGAGDAQANAGVIQGDGKIVAAGGGSQFNLVRYNTDGSLDTTFGTGGIVTTNLPVNNNSAQGLALQSDGKLVAAGGTNPTQNGDCVIARFNTDGSLDTSYGTGGIVTSAWGQGGSWLSNVVIQGDGKAVCAGVSQTSNQVGQFMMARYNTDGSPDTSFGTGGCKVTPVGSYGNQVWGLALQTDGKLVACGDANTSLGSASGAANVALARYNADGSMDTSFGTGGEVVQLYGSYDDGCFISTAVDAGGNLIAGGVLGTTASGTEQFTLARFTATGALDTTFGNGGFTVGSMGYYSNLWSVAIQSNGRIVGAGSTHINVNGSWLWEILVARYLP